jgi:hypothetical protein
MKSLVLLVTSFVLFASMLPAATDYVGNGYQYLGQGDLERAERMFKAAIKIDVDNDQAWAGLKKVHAAQSKSGKAAAPARRTRRAASQADSEAVDDSRQYSRPRATSLDSDASAGESDEVEPAPQVEEINKKLLTKYLSGGRRGDAEEEEEEIEPAKPAKGKSKPARRSQDKDGESASAAPAPQEKLDDTIDKNLLRDAKKANDEFNRLREWATTGWKRDSSGATQFIPTYYSPQLYKLLVTKLGAQKNWSISDTQKKYRRLMGDNRGVLEFYVKVINTTRKPKAAVSVSDICDRTVLEDDNGNSYKPVRFKAPSVTKLLDEDSYTVWFPKYDADGNAVVDKARQKLFLVINDQENEPATIRIVFTKKQFESKVGKKDSGKSWWKLF